MDSPGLDGEVFKVSFGQPIDNLVLNGLGNTRLKIVKRLRFKTILTFILYYITLGLVDKRGYFYKVKVEEI